MLYRRLALVLLLLCALAPVAWAGPKIQYVYGTTTQMHTPNSIASNAYTGTSATLDPGGYLYCNFKAVLAFGTAPNANAALYVWLKVSIDGGSTFSDTPTSSIVTGPPYVIIPITSGQTTTNAVESKPCPAGQFQLVLQMNNTGQTTSGSGNAVSVQPYTPQAN